MKGEFQITANKTQRFLIYLFYGRSTCFRWFLLPSSGAHNCTYRFRYCQPILLLAATMEEMEIKKHCILLAIIWNYITMHRHMNIYYDAQTYEYQK